LIDVVALECALNNAFEMGSGIAEVFTVAVDGSEKIGAAFGRLNANHHERHAIHGNLKGFFLILGQIGNAHIAITRRRNGIITLWWCVFLALITAGAGKLNDVIAHDHQLYQKLSA